jgi:RHS repeat-associated protein
VVAATDPAAGTVTAAASYDPWGTPIGTTGTLPAGYQGGYTDPDTGQVDAAARWYQPTTGTFTSRDTATLTPDPIAQTNRYTYADDSPTNANDPTGHCICLLIDLIVEIGIEIATQEPAGDPCYGANGLKPDAPDWCSHKHAGTAAIGLAGSGHLGVAGSGHIGPAPSHSSGNKCRANCDTSPRRKAPPPNRVAPRPPLTDHNDRPVFVDPTNGHGIDNPVPGPTNPVSTDDDGGGLGWLFEFFGTVASGGAAAVNTAVSGAAAGAGALIEMIGVAAAAAVAELTSPDPGPSRPPTSDDDRDDCLSGNQHWIRYSPKDHGIADPRGRASGADACYTGGQQIPEGAPATYDPPGLDTAADMQRGHLIAKSLGGDNGPNGANITPLYGKANRKMFNLAERYIKPRVEAGENVYLVVTPLYDADNPVPFAITIQVYSNRSDPILLSVRNGGYYHGIWRPGG